MKKTLIYLIILLLIIGIISYLSILQTKEKTSTKPKQENKSIAVLTGNGKGDSTPFEIKKTGLVIFQITHQTSDINSYFDVSLYNWNDKNKNAKKDANETSLINSLESVAYDRARNYNSSIAQKVLAGKYFLKFDASGRWETKILLPQTGSNLITKKFKGHASQATNLFYLKKGKTTFHISHINGNDNFKVFLLDKQGNNLKLLVNQIGLYSGKIDFDIKFDDEYLLQVIADGDWKIKI